MEPHALLAPPSLVTLQLDDSDADGAPTCAHPPLSPQEFHRRLAHTTLLRAFDLGDPPLSQLVGSGTYGKVFRGSCRSSGRAVAVKVLGVFTPPAKARAPFTPFERGGLSSRSRR